MGSFVGRENQYTQLVKFLHCKLPTISKHLRALQHKVPGLNHQLQRWEASVLPLLHHGPRHTINHINNPIIRTKEMTVFSSLIYSYFQTSSVIAVSVGSNPPASDM